MIRKARKTPFAAVRRVLTRMSIMKSGEGDQEEEEGSDNESLQSSHEVPGNLVLEEKRHILVNNC